MAHYQEIEFVRRVKQVFPEYFQRKRILEIGSWDTNGTVRNFFEDCDYTGVDVASGPGVDLVGLGNEVDLPTRSFDLVISCECFEHNPYWAETFANMIRMLKKGGLCLVTCASTGRIEHGTYRSNPLDSLANIENIISYYRNLDELDFRRAIDIDLHFGDYFFSQNIYHCDLQFVGIKSVVDHPCREHRARMANLRCFAEQITKIPPPTHLDRLFAQSRFIRNRTIKRMLGESFIHELRYKIGKIRI
jgi:SAM-dependent methyltransferase